MSSQLESDFPTYQPRPKGAELALQGLKAVDFTHFIAGPFATLILADMGAEAIKVEAPGKGDAFRHYPPMVPAFAGVAPFIRSNPNNRSIALNLKSPEGVAVALELV